MNRSVCALLVALVVLVLNGCQPAADTNRNLAAASASPAREAFDPAAIETEVMKLAREWMKSAQTYDAEVINRVVADDAVLVYPDGSPATKADELRLVDTKAITADSWEMLDAKVTVTSADSAFITGRSVVKNGKYKDPSAKRPIDISGEYRFLDVYARRNGKWQVVASQATKVENLAPAASPLASPAASVTPSPSPAASRTTSPKP
jgi:ketosteroid isomerase-like protein